MNAIGYVRVSTEEQTNGVSLEAQEAKIRAWCTLHDAELVAIYRDEGISGYKRRDSRPGLDRALKQVCKIKGSLVVYSLSRLARNTRETIEIGECLNTCGADLVSLSEDITYGSPIFKAVQKKWSPALYRAVTKSPRAPESAVGAGSTPSHVERYVGGL